MTYNRFMEIAREENCLSILQTWDENSFKLYEREFGPLDDEKAHSLVRFMCEMETAFEEEMQ